MGPRAIVGDQRLDNASGEQCDDGNAETEPCPYGLPNCMVCDENCQNVVGETSYCGDGIVDRANGESCEPGGPVGCDFNSQLVFYDNSNQVPQQNGDQLYIIDVHGMSEYHQG